MTLGEVFGGFVAAAVAGGAIVRFSSPQTNIAQLIDGQVENDGWVTLDSLLPTEVVFAFRNDRLALIDKVVLNPHSKTTVTAYLESSLASAQADDRFQFERHGYFVADRHDHTAAHPVFNRTTTLQDTWAKS